MQFQPRQTATFRAFPPALFTYLLPQLFLPSYFSPTPLSIKIDVKRQVTRFRFRSGQNAILKRFRLRHLGNPRCFAKCFQLGCSAPIVCDQLPGECVDRKWLWNLRLCVSMWCEEGGYHEERNTLCYFCLLWRQCAEYVDIPNSNFREGVLTFPQKPTTLLAKSVKRLPTFRLR